MMSPAPGSPAGLESAATRSATVAATHFRSTPLGYQPALDGLRGVAVVAVLLFHAGLSWASGGYLGVSIFFTLSGFLITRLLLEERARTGRIDLTTFYARRLRRLVPASAFTLVSIVILAHAGAFGPITSLRRQLVGAALQIGNWSQLTSTRSYADLFGAQASPVDHYWSLAIEEQFYLIWPLVLVPIVALSARTARRVIVALFVAAAGLVTIISAGWGPDAVYLSTPSRIAEILAGAALAAVLDLGRLPSVLRVGSVIAALMVMIAFATTPTDHGWPYQGGLPVFAVLSSIVVAGAMANGPVRTLLSGRLPRWLGSISYSLYLVHWPIYLLVDAQLSLTGIESLAVKFAASLAVAVGVALLVEQPVRGLRIRSSTIPFGLAAVAATLIAATLVSLPQPPVIDRVSKGFEQDVPAADDGSAISALTVPGATLVEPADDSGTPTSVAAPARPVRMMVIGDSTGDVVGGGLVAWANENPTVAQVEVRSVPGCGFVSGGRFGNFIDQHRERCDAAMLEEIPAAIAGSPPDVVVIMISLADTWDRSWDDGPELRAADPTYTARIRDGYNSFFDTAAAAGVAHVVWLRPPVTGLSPNDYDASFVDGSQEIVEAVVDEAVERHPTMITQLDFRTWFEGTSLPADEEARPDGVHLAPAAALHVATEFLGPEITRIVQQD